MPDTMPEVDRHPSFLSERLIVMPDTVIVSVRRHPSGDVIYAINHSVTRFPTAMKVAIVKPFLKKVNADETDMKNYRPVSNWVYS